ncbi:MAG: hypothetical protein [Caudoviricetes sp.]|nr:MAG: hypothetical protein [Caudoviricetes sp.]
MQYKIGDEVVLRPETKPYTFTELPCGYSERQEELPEKITYMVDYIHSDGDIYIVSNCWCGHIRPHHLKHAKEDTAFEDYHEKLHQQYSDSFNKLERDMKEKLERLQYTNIGSKSNPEWEVKEALKLIIPLAKDSGMTKQDFVDLIDKY